MDYCGVCGQEASRKCIDCGALRCSPPSYYSDRWVTHPASGPATVRIADIDVVFSPTLDFARRLPFVAALPVGLCEECLRARIELGGNDLTFDGAEDIPQFLRAGVLMRVFDMLTSSTSPNLGGWRSPVRSEAELFKAIAAQRLADGLWKSVRIIGGPKSARVLDMPHRIGDYDSGYQDLPWSFRTPFAITEDGSVVTPVKRPAFSFAPSYTEFYAPSSPPGLDRPWPDWGTESRIHSELPGMPPIGLVRSAIHAKT